MTTVGINEEVLKMRFEKVYSRFMYGKITAEEACKLIFGSGISQPATPMIIFS
jgi:hypothetical protein